MSLAEKLATPKGGSNQGLPCSVATLLTDLPVAESAALQSMLDSPWRIWGHQRIEVTLADEGHSVGTGSIGKHRRRTCRCSKVSG